MKMKRIIILIFKLYQKIISPLKPPSCRFIPTCSNYAIEAVETHGTFKGLMLAVKRISKCHPFHKGGYDPVPPKKTKKGKN